MRIKLLCKAARLQLLLSCLASFFFHEQILGDGCKDCPLLISNLSEHPRWLALGHYRNYLWGKGYKGDIDSAGFYLAPSGKYDPRAELEATLNAFRKEQQNSNERHDQCLFPARLAFLQDEASELVAKLPKVVCPERDWWLSQIQPDTMTLVFASHYFSNPGSMFGHTFIRFDDARRGARAGLLSYGVNFGAEAPEDDGPLFYFKGLAGGYPGRWGILPYYEKVQEYAAFESRDLWEYRLRTKPEDVALVIAHLWELREHYVDYYFLDENCAFHILALVEIARPNLQLRNDYAIWTDPAQTIRALMRNPNAVDNIDYRASLLSNFNARFKDLSKSEKAILHRLVIDDDYKQIMDQPPFVAGRQAAVLDAALEILHFKQRQLRKDVDQSLLERRQWLGAKRAALGVVEHASSYQKNYDASPPEVGHELCFVAVGIKTLNLEKSLTSTLRLRPAYHDLLSRPLGYKEYAEIILTDALLFWDQTRRRIDLEAFTLVRYGIFAPRTAYVQKSSYQLDARMERDLITHRLGGLFEGATGYSWGAEGLPILSVLADARVKALSARYAAGFGPKLQILWNPWQGVQMRAAGLYVLERWSKGDKRWDPHFESQWDLATSPTKNFELRISARSSRDIWRTSLESGYFF